MKIDNQYHFFTNIWKMLLAIFFTFIWAYEFYNFFELIC
jgi:hypothetical protein